MALLKNLMGASTEQKVISSVQHLEFGFAEAINKISKEKGFVEEGDMLINLAAMPVIDKGMVNTLRISQIN